MDDSLEKRIHELAQRLERRSRQCPGLFILESSDEFMALAVHLHPKNRECLALTLESFDRHPDRCHQAVNQWLLAHGMAGVRMTGHSVDDYRRLRQSVLKALKSTCQSRTVSAA
jgi:hypothetical protein